MAVDRGHVLTQTPDISHQTSVNYLRGAELVSLRPCERPCDPGLAPSINAPQVGSEHDVSGARLSLSPVNSGPRLKNEIGHFY